jgi:hypothetical protein
MDINIHTLFLSLDLGPVAFRFCENVEEREESNNESKLVKFYKLRSLEILRVWQLNFGNERMRD